MILKGKRKSLLKKEKQKRIELFSLTNIYDELNTYIKTLEGTEWLFPSRKGDKPISRIQAYRQLNKAAEMVDMPDGSELIPCEKHSATGIINKLRM